MDSKQKSTDLRKPGKQKGKKRGEQKQKSEYIDNGSSEINVFKAQAMDNKIGDESKDLIINKESIDNSLRLDRDVNENAEYYETKTDALKSEESPRVEVPQLLLYDANRDPPDDENLRDKHSIADKNENILTIEGINIPTKSAALNYAIPSENLPRNTRVMSTQSSSEGFKEFYRLNSTTKIVTPLYNSRALDKEAETYELHNFRKNKLIILNNKDFGKHTRWGSEIDVKALTETFEAFNFEVKDYLNPTLYEIYQVLKEISDTNFTDYGCLAIAVLTHGGDIGKLLAADEDYYETKIINYLKTHKNHSLISKPRLLLVQACRGPNSLVGVSAHKVENVREELNYDTEPYTLPVEADMLVVHSSYAGNKSHRHTLQGTWFIQTLCKKIKELAPTEDFETILTHMKRAVAIDKEHEDFNEDTNTHEINKQMPVVTSTLIRKLYLNKNTVKVFSDEAVASCSVSTDNPVDIQNAEKNQEPQQCLCTLDYFQYIKECLRVYLENNENKDDTAKLLFELAESLKDGEKFKDTKETCAMTIANFLEKKMKCDRQYRLIYIKKKIILQNIL